jgi:hydroxymethylpyrimidine pyrophosphatase-like HAD family hydrolase
LTIRAIATDYDGTLAKDGRAGGRALAALRQARSTGTRLLLITGRERVDLQQVFPELPLFDLVIAENGGLLYFPATGEERPLGEPPPPELIAALRGEGIGPLSIGRCIVATLLPHEDAILRIVRELGINWHMSHNREAIMLLPGGIDKGSGLRAALREFGLQGEQVLGIGDAENDLVFLGLCGRAVAVANALPGVKEAVDQVTQGARGAGVAEIIHQFLSGAFD